jgi:hypothetical protein
MTTRNLLREPSAFLPLTMSAMAIAIVYGHAAMFGVVHESDEGTPAHIFQLLMVVQLPIILYFMVKWLPQAPRQSLPVIALQALAVIVAFTGVFLLT